MDRVRGKGFSGTLRNCIKHARAQLPQAGSKLLGEIWEELGNELGVGRASAYRWFSQDPESAVGINRLRLWAWLELHGYHIEEYAQLPEQVRKLARLALAQLISMEDIRDATTIQEESQTEPSPVLLDSAARYVRTGAGLSEERIAAIQAAIIDPQKDLLDELEAKIPILALHALASATRTEPEATPQASPPLLLGAGVIAESNSGAATGNGKRRDPAARVMEPQTTTLALDLDTSKVQIIRLLASLIKTTLPLAEIVESDLMSPEDRVELHRLSGTDAIFKLANRMTRLAHVLDSLCSERSREIARLREGK